MYHYLFLSNTPQPALIYHGDSPPPGYISFAGNPLADSDGYVDWSQVTHDSGTLTEIPKPAVVEPEPYVAPEPTVEQVKYSELSSIKSALQSTDYQCLKFVDGALTPEEYQPVKAYRATLRELYATAEQANDVSAIQTLPVPQSFGNDAVNWAGTQWNFAGALGNE